MGREEAEVTDERTLTDEEIRTEWPEGSSAGGPVAKADDDDDDTTDTDTTDTDTTDTTDDDATDA
jgi:hypothetical protein